MIRHCMLFSKVTRYLLSFVEVFCYSYPFACYSHFNWLNRCSSSAWDIKGWSQLNSKFPIHAKFWVQLFTIFSCRLFFFPFCIFYCCFGLVLFGFILSVFILSLLLFCFALFLHSWSMVTATHFNVFWWCALLRNNSFSKNRK